MQNISLKIDPDSPVPKFQQLADEILNAINYKKLKVGDPLPSVNTVIKESGVSRDTIVKAYNILKRKGIIESYPQKGYFVSCNSGRVFLFLDTFKAYKEVLYDSFRTNLSDDYTIDLHFHHYDIDIFRKLINESAGKYSKYVIMNFDHKNVKSCLSQIDPEKLLIIDWDIHTPEGASVLKQDFNYGLENALNKAKDEICRYKRFIYMYPSYTYHPVESVDAFKRFCINCGIEWKVNNTTGRIDPEQGDLFLSVSDRALAKLIDNISEKNMTPGKDVGIISYNETPMKKYIQNGISVISTDFEEMGKLAAKFVMTNKPVNKVVLTQMIKRNSL